MRASLLYKSGYGYWEDSTTAKHLDVVQLINEVIPMLYE